MEKEAFESGLRNLVIAVVEGHVTDKQFKEYAETARQVIFKAGYELGLSAASGQTKDIPQWLVERMENGNE